MPSGVQEELPGCPYGWVWRWSHRRHKLELKRNVSKCDPCVSSGKLCIEVTPQSKIAWISESLCIGCGICIKVILAPEYLARNDLFRLLLVTTFKLLRVCFWSLFRDFFSLQKCPFGALSIVNLPSNLEKETTHRYCANAFKLHRYGDKPPVCLPSLHSWAVFPLTCYKNLGKQVRIKFQRSCYSWIAPLVLITSTMCYDFNFSYYWLIDSAFSFCLEGPQILSLEAAHQVRCGFAALSNTDFCWNILRDLRRNKLFCSHK